MTLKLTKNGQTAAVVTFSKGCAVARLYAQCDGMVARFKTLSEAVAWAELELS